MNLIRRHHQGICILFLHTFSAMGEFSLKVGSRQRPLSNSWHTAAFVARLAGRRAGLLGPIAFTQIVLLISWVLHGFWMCSALCSTGTRASLARGTSLGFRPLPYVFPNKEEIELFFPSTIVQLLLESAATLMISYVHVCVEDGYVSFVCYMLYAVVISVCSIA